MHKHILVSSGEEEAYWVVYALLMKAKLTGIKTEFNVIVKEVSKRAHAAGRCHYLIVQNFKADLNNAMCIKVLSVSL